MNHKQNTASIYTLLLAFCFPLTGLADDADIPYEAPSYKFGLSQGIKQEDFYWNISGLPPAILPCRPEGTSPVNILSELEWRDMELDHTQFLFEARQSQLLARVDFDFGRITSGRNQDSDYLENNRSNEFSRSYSDVNGETLGINFTLGYEFSLLLQSSHHRLTLTPMIGIAKYEQKLGMHNGTKVVAHDCTNSIPVNQPLTGLDSSYDTDWNTKWLGGEFTWQPNTKITLSAGYQYHFDIDYTAIANWNINQIFNHPISFIHEADEGEGHRFSFITSYQLKPSLQLNLQYSYFRIKATYGLDTTFTAFGIGTTGLNIAESESHSLRLGFTWTP